MTDTPTLAQDIPANRHDDNEMMIRLEHRLKMGAELIEHRRTAGLDTTSLEEFWRMMLRDYTTLLEANP